MPKARLENISGPAHSHLPTDAR